MWDRNLPLPFLSPLLPLLSSHTSLVLFSSVEFLLRAHFPPSQSTSHTIALPHPHHHLLHFPPFVCAHRNDAAPHLQRLYSPSTPSDLTISSFKGGGQVVGLYVLFADSLRFSSLLCRNLPTCTFGYKNPPSYLPGLRNEAKYHKLVALLFLPVVASFTPPF